MSAIGNYVHYRWSNYLEAGTSRVRYTGYNAFDAWQSQRNDIISRAEKLANSGLRQHEKSTKDLEKLLNSLLVPADSASGKVAEVHRKIEQLLQEDFGDALQKIDLETGNVSFKNLEKDHIGKARTVNIEDIVNRINRLEVELIRQVSTGSTIPKDVFRNVETLKSMYGEALTALQKIKASKGGAVLSISKKIFDEDLELGRQVLNDLIQEYAAFPAMGLQKGKLFEYLIAYAPLAMDDAADEAIGEVVGDIAGVVGYNRDSFDSYFTASQNIDGILAITHASQGKIDVTLDWQGKELNISAKNVNLDNDWVRLVSDSSLLYLLQDEDPQFVNHFLNIFATHGQKGSNKASLTAFRNRMLEEVKLILFYKALTGDTYGRKAANVFILNDNRTGRVKVYSIPDLIDKVAQKPIKGIQLNGKTFTASTSLKNNWHRDSAQARIGTLLAEAHSKKVKVSINASMFR